MSDNPTKQDNDLQQLTVQLIKGGVRVSISVDFSSLLSSPQAAEFRSEVAASDIQVTGTHLGLQTQQMLQQVHEQALASLYRELAEGLKA